MLKPDGPQVPVFEKEHGRDTTPGIVEAVKIFKASMEAHDAEPSDITERIRSLVNERSDRKDAEKISLTVEDESWGGGSVIIGRGLTTVTILGSDEEGKLSTEEFLKQLEEAGLISSSEN